MKAQSDQMYIRDYPGERTHRMTRIVEQRRLRRCCSVAFGCGVDCALADWRTNVTDVTGCPYIYKDWTYRQILRQRQRLRHCRDADDGRRRKKERKRNWKALTTLPTKTNEQEYWEEQQQRWLLLLSASLTWGKKGKKREKVSQLYYSYSILLAIQADTLSQHEVHRWKWCASSPNAANMCRYTHICTQTHCDCLLINMNKWSGDLAADNGRLFQS